jgi:YHS domain-containing protein
MRLFADPWRQTKRIVAAGAIVAPGAETVSLATAETVVFEGTTYVFCCAGCRARFEAEPSRYAVVGA